MMLQKHYICTTKRLIHILVTKSVLLIEKENVSMKEKYTIPELEVVILKCEDIVTSSREEDETPFVPYCIDDDTF